MTAPERRWTLAGLIVLASIGVLDHDLWTPDEPRVASVGRSVARGHWVVPVLGDEPFLEQPPLHAWLVGAFYRSFGSSPECAPRILSSLCGLATIAFAASLVRTLLRSSTRVGPQQDDGKDALVDTAWWTAAALALTVEFFTTQHRVVVDGVLTLCTTAAAAFAAQAHSASHARTRWGACGLASAAAALAFLAKGPIGIAVPGLFCVALVIVRGGAGRLFAPLFVVGPVVAAAIVGPWLYFAWQETEGAVFDAIFVHNFVGRVAAEAGSRGHVRPIYYYLIHFPVHALPLTLPLVGAVIDAVRTRIRTPASAITREREVTDVALLWLGFGIGMLSLASTKRAVYIVPFLPAGAIASALWLLRFARDERRSAYAKWFPRLLVGFTAVIALAIPVARVWLSDLSLVLALAATTAGLGAAVAAGRAFARGRNRTGLSRWYVGFVLCIAVSASALLPPLDAIKSLGPITRRVADLVPASEPIYLFDPDETTAGLVSLYTDRKSQPIYSEAEIRAKLEEVPRVYVLAIDKTRRRTHRRFEVLRPYAAEILIEDLRPHSRAIRLVRLERD